MKRERKNRVVDQKNEQGKSRKQVRKEKKEAKKDRIRHHFKNQSQPSSVQTGFRNKISKQNVHSKLQDRKKAVEERKEVKPHKESKPVEQRKSVEETQDDKLIKLYQSKLGVKEGKEKYNKIAKNYGFDDDLFDFLDGITKKVSKPTKKPAQQEDNDNEEDENESQLEDEDEMQGQEQQEEEGDDANEDADEPFDEEYDRMFDNLDQVGEEIDQEEQEQFEEEGLEQIDQVQIDEQGEEEEEEIDEEANQQIEEPEVQAQVEKPSGYRNPFLKKGEQPVSQEEKEVKRSMNALFNKLSDGNILLTFRQFMGIIESHPRSLTIPIYSDLFMRFNLLIEKPLFHILATNVALASALHYAFGNRLMAPVLHILTSKFIELSNEGENEQEVLQFGYSKRYERLKNYATIVSLLYTYGSITGDFLESLVSWLTKSLNRYNIELLYIIIQKCGMKIRQNDPSALKSIIAVIKESISSYRREHIQGEEHQKINFIELELSDIKFNKKAQFNPDQRMAFLETFIFKNVPKQIETEKEIFMLKFEELINIDTSRTTWWERDNYAANELEGEIAMEDYNEVAAEKRKLMDLAKSFHMVTEVKKNIFLCLMDSKDYLEATQRILEMRIKNFQDVATVLVEVCTLQPNFNPYYPLVASKLASVNAKFRLNLQYAIWDHLKLIHQYQLRRTSNLAKFSAKLISDSLSNSSLSILKFFPDLSNIRAIDTTFLNIFFTYFFKKVKKEYLSKLVGKLREDNNRNIKEGIKEFLSEFECEEGLREKVKLCRRLLMLQLDERKMERGDEE